MVKQRIMLTESQLNRVIKESVKRVLNEEWDEYQPSKRSIKWDKLISDIKKQIRSSLAFAHANPGLYTLQRMASFMDSEEPGYRWSNPELAKRIGEIISRFDVRNVGELLEFCDKLHLSYPKWLKKGVTAELTDDGWVLFGK